MRRWLHADRHLASSPSSPPSTPSGPTRSCRACPAPSSFVAPSTPESSPTTPGCCTSASTHTFGEVTKPDVLVVPGGDGHTAAIPIRANHPRVGPIGRTRPATWTTSVCTGSLVLGAAGILDGKPATSHWSIPDGAPQVRRRAGSRERVVEDGKVMTAAGVSAGIDMALTLAARTHGRRRRQGDPARDRVRPASRPSTPGRPRRPTRRSSTSCAGSSGSRPEPGRFAGAITRAATMASWRKAPCK